MYTRHTLVENNKRKKKKRVVYVSPGDHPKSINCVSDRILRENEDGVRVAESERRKKKFSVSFM